MPKRKYFDDGDEVVRDGKSVRVKMVVMDGWAADLRRRNPGVGAFDADNHRPHFARLSDAEIAMRRQARDAWIEQQRNAWRMPSRVAAAAPVTTYRRLLSMRDAQAARDASYDAYGTRLGNSWRTLPARVRDAAEPDVSEQLLRRHLAGPDDPDEDGNGNGDPQSARDLAYWRYVDQLGRAWQTSLGDANSVEQERRRWTHES
jgi:hypothetical protein